MASTNRAEHIISGSKLNPVYLDSGSNLNKDQINTINTILFNNYRRFRRSVNTVEEDEPVTLKNFTSFSKSIQNVFDKSYGDVHTISFLMRVKDLKKDEEMDIGFFKTAPDLFFQAGGSGLTRSEPLPGYFYTKNDRLVFRHSADKHYSSFFQCYLFWIDQ